MAIVTVVTEINAPIEAVFDLARSLKAHERSVAWTRERVVSSHKRDLLELGDEVTFEAVHFGVRQRLTARIVNMTPPTHFHDVMLDGAFARLTHDHRFEPTDGGTRMIDEIIFEPPYGFIGRFVASLFLPAYMRRFLERRCKSLKEMAEHLQHENFRKPNLPR